MRSSPLIAFATLAAVASTFAAPVSTYSRQEDNESGAFSLSDAAAVASIGNSVISVVHNLFGSKNQRDLSDDESGAFICGRGTNLNECGIIRVPSILPSVIAKREALDLETGSLFPPFQHIPNTNPASAAFGKQRTIEGRAHGLAGSVKDMPFISRRAIGDDSGAFSTRFVNALQNVADGKSAVTKRQLNNILDGGKICVGLSCSEHPIPGNHFAIGRSDAEDESDAITLGALVDHLINKRQRIYFMEELVARSLGSLEELD